MSGTPRPGMGFAPGLRALLAAWRRRLPHTPGGSDGRDPTRVGPQAASWHAGEDGAPALPAAPLTAVLEAVGDGAWDWDMGVGRVRYSPRWKALLGFGEGDIGEHPDEWRSRIHPDDLPLWERGMARHRAGETGAFDCEYRLRCRDGSWRWVQDRGRVLERGPQGEPRRAVGALRDIAHRKRVERSLARLVTLETVLLEASRALAAASPETVEQVADRVLGALAWRLDLERAFIFRLTPDGSRLRASHRWSATGLAPGPPDVPPLLARDLPCWMETLRHGEDIRIGDVARLPPAWGRDRAVLEALGICAAAAVPLRIGERLAGCLSAQMLRGARHWHDSELRALRLLGDLIGAALERCRLELDLLESRQRLEEVALYDPLTGLPNRRLLAERMRSAMELALDTGTGLAVCYLDLDGFKAVNDTYGPELGDRILAAAAARLRSQVRESDTVARLGGDDLVVLLGGLESLIECANLLDRLIRAMAQPYALDGLELRVTVSGGVTLYPRDDHDADTLLRHADHAMYEAKQRGRNRYVFFDTLRDRRAHVRRSQLRRIAEAIDGGELVLFYQPKVDMRRGRVIGAEALVRWQHPERGLLPPGAFIPLLDGTELQQRLDWWVVAQGLRQLADWRTVGLDLGLSVNISARSVQHPGFVDDLGARLREDGGLAPDLLSLEILESEALVDLDAVADVIRRCEALGVCFALDDFGTGYSSLTYFRRLPAQVLKIDQTFVRDMLRSPDDRNIVEGVVGLARAFRRQVIAEGVESAAHGLMLLRMGCEQAQGYGVAEPMPAERFPGWVASYAPPSLWSLSPDFEWSGQTLECLTMESSVRDWVARALRAAAATETKPQAAEQIEDAGVFGRWYGGEGRRHFGRLEPFRALDSLHREVDGCARRVLAARERGGDPGAVAALLDARDRLIVALHALQEQVLRQVACAA